MVEKPAIRKKLFLNIVTTKKLFQNFYKAIISNSAQFACKFKGLALLLYNVTTKFTTLQRKQKLLCKKPNSKFWNLAECPSTQNESTGSLPISDFEPAIILKYAQPILIPATKSTNYF